MATIKDVAEKAGLAVATVSRVLNNRGYISQKTRERVYEVMKELNYQPNEIARALTKQNTNILGVIVPSILHPFFSMCLHYFEKHAAIRGYKLMICNSQRNTEKEIEYIDMLKSNQVAGIILCTRADDLDEKLNINLPLITFERSVSDKLPAILCDNYKGGVLATQCLLEAGCKHLAIIHGSFDAPLPADDRFKAFMDVCKKHNVKTSAFETREKQFEAREYSEPLDKMMTNRRDIDGIFATSDLIAAQVIQACARKNLNIPNDIKLVGFDDVEMASLTTPPLTTIRQPIEEMCEYAVATIQKQSKGEMVATTSVFPVELVMRGSV